MADQPPRTITGPVCGNVNPWSQDICLRDECDFDLRPIKQQIMGSLPAVNSPPPTHLTRRPNPASPRRPCLICRSVGQTSRSRPLSAFGASRSLRRGLRVGQVRRQRGLVAAPGSDPRSPAAAQSHGPCLGVSPGATATTAVPDLYPVQGVVRHAGQQVARLSTRRLEAIVGPALWQLRRFSLIARITPLSAEPTYLGLNRQLEVQEGGRLAVTSREALG